MTTTSTALSPEDCQTLSALAEKSQDDALCAAVTSYLEGKVQSAEANGTHDAEAEQAFLRAAGAWQAEVLDRLRQIGAELKLGCIVSKVHFTDKIEADTFDWDWQTDDGAARKDKVSIKVTKSEAEKCARCWKFVDTVGTASNPELCSDCSEVEAVLAEI